MRQPRSGNARPHLRVLAAGLAAALLSAEAGAQGDRSVEIKAVAGYAGFIDEALLDHFVVGGAARIPLSPEWDLEPEFLYMRQSPRHDDLSFQAGAAWTFWRGPRAETYLVGAVGVLHSRFEFPGARDPRFSSNKFTGGGGAGLRLGWGDRLVLTPEARLGWEPLVRFTIGIGYEFD